MISPPQVRAVATRTALVALAVVAPLVLAAALWWAGCLP